MEKCYCVGDVDPAKKEVPTKGVVFFAFVKVAAKKKRHSNFLLVVFFFLKLESVKEIQCGFPPKKILLATYRPK